VLGCIRRHSGSETKRREFITLPEPDPEKWLPVFRKDHAQTKGWSGMTIHFASGGAAVVSPIAALAQQNDRIRRIGILPGTTTEHDPESEACL
jgi:hypothetical protein